MTLNFDDNSKLTLCLEQKRSAVLTKRGWKDSIGFEVNYFFLPNFNGPEKKNIPFIQFVSISGEARSVEPESEEDSDRYERLPRTWPLNNRPHYAADFLAAKKSFSLFFLWRHVGETALKTFSRASQICRKIFVSINRVKKLWLKFLL